MSDPRQIERGRSEANTEIHDFVPDIVPPVPAANHFVPMLAPARTGLPHAGFGRLGPGVVFLQRESGPLIRPRVGLSALVAWETQKSALARRMYAAYCGLRSPISFWSSATPDTRINNNDIRIGTVMLNQARRNSPRIESPSDAKVAEMVGVACISPKYAIHDPTLIGRVGLGAPNCQSPRPRRDYCARGLIASAHATCERTTLRAS